MGPKIVKNFGEWKSPLSSAKIASAAIGLAETAWDGDDLYWTELRPTEGGRQAVVKRDSEGKISDVTPPPFSARTRIHEYGGAAFTVKAGVLFFSNLSDQKIYQQLPGKDPVAVTEKSQRRFGDFVVNATSSWLIAVCENHEVSGQEAVNSIVLVDLKTGGIETLVSGKDFFAFPRLNPEATQLTWIAWSHPHMPWDESELWLADIDAHGKISNSRKIAGEPGESINEPQWSPAGVLYFVSDRSQWWNLYRWQKGQAECVYSAQAEFTGPLWTLGASSYSFLSETEIVSAYVVKGQCRLAIIDSPARTLTDVKLPFSEYRQVRTQGGRVSFLAASATEPWTLVEWNHPDGSFQSIRKAINTDIDPGYFSKPKAIEYPNGRGTMAYGFYYPPANLDYQGPADQTPPLIVISHGGPTSHCATNLNLGIQFWCSRGFAVLDVNYGGSTGFGTAYRRRLNGQWGVVDVQDCIAGANYLVAEQLADKNRLIIRGGSAGGFTTLAALTFHQVFKAGASHYGVSDIELLAKDTHKFESKYDASLIGPYPECRDLFIARSPIHFAHQISCPLILLQGLDDKVVPPSQSEKMYEAVKAKGIPVAYLTFAGEDHGFRKQESIRRALDSELYFYSRVFKFELAEVLPPIAIANL